MKAPQVIWCVIAAMNIGMELTRHGEPKRETYNVWFALAGLAINYAILRWGGFFG